MVKYILIGFTFFFVTGIIAQDWKTDYNEALASAKAESKPLILVFTGSDWCAPCIRLDKSIFTSEEFKEYSSKNYVLYRADFPRKKTNQLPTELINQNKKLAERYNPRGRYPLVLVLDDKEQVLGKTGYKRVSPKAYINKLNSFL